MEVNIKNYQVVKDAKLEIEPGITAIVGDSNNGKSSIIRAIEAAINNKGGDGFINYDADACKVTIEDKDHEIIWYKNRASRKSYYEIDGKKLKKIGQKQLDEVGALLDMSEIEVNRERFRLNFWKQMDYPFLVGRSAYQLFDFISKSEEQEIIQELKDESASDLKQLSKDIDYKSAQIDTKTTDIQDLSEEVSTLKKFSDFDISRFEALASVEEELDELLYSLGDIENSIEDRKDFLDGIKPKIKNLSDLYSKIEDNTSLAKGLSEELEHFNTTEQDIFDTKKRIKGTEEEISSISSKVSSLDGLMKEYKNLHKTHIEYRTLSEKLHSVKDTIEDRRAAVKKAEEEIKRVNEELSEFKVCPLCGSSLEGGHKHDK